MRLRLASRRRGRAKPGGTPSGGPQRAPVCLKGRGRGSLHTVTNPQELAFSVLPITLHTQHMLWGMHSYQVCSTYVFTARACLGSHN
eukprot:2531231-Prymnesium_polylepis.2